MVFVIDSIIEDRFKEFEELERYSLDSLISTLHDNPYMQKAIDIVYGAIVGEGVPVAAIRGPPGTGKTRVYERVIEMIMDKNDLEPDELLVYIAPTNQLVAEMLERITKLYYIYSQPGSDEQARKKRIEKIAEEVRVYGSRFEAYREPFLKMRGKVTDKTKIILTTSRQYSVLKSALRFKNLEKVKVLVDEASRTVLHEAFIPIAPLVGTHEKGMQILGALTVIGDPQQAILLDDAFRADLLLLRLEKILEESHAEQIAKLEITYRLPEPSEKPISTGFYDGKLKAYENAQSRLRKLEDVIEERLRGFERDEQKRVIAERVREAVLSRKPLLIIETIASGGYSDIFDYPKWEGHYHHVSPGRARIAAQTALVIAGLTGETVTVVVPYNDMEAAVRQELRNQASSNIDIKKIRVTTIGSILGGEDDHVVAVLGKEWTSISDEYHTVYYKEPQQLNVQLSRHKKMLVVIGNLYRLARATERFLGPQYQKGAAYLARTARTLYELCGVEVKKSGKRKVSEGEGGLYLDAREILK